MKRLILQGWILPFIMSCMVYYGFSTNYTAHVFSEVGFTQQYEHGIYKYRVLGPTLLQGTYDLMKQYGIPAFAPIPHGLNESIDSNEFYSAYFYLNTLFLCLTSSALFITFREFSVPMMALIADLALLLLTSLIALTQYVVVPYDMLLYFFLAVSALLIIRNSGSTARVVALGICVILAALTRETAALILSFYFTVHYQSLLKKPKGFRLNREQFTILMLTLCFICTYLALRSALGTEHGMFEYIRFRRNVSEMFPILGLLFFVTASAIFCETRIGRRETIIFLLTSSPYSLSILVVANPWEIRLWTPLIIMIVILKLRALGVIARQPITEETGLNSTAV